MKVEAKALSTTKGAPRACLRRTTGTEAPKPPGAGAVTGAEVTLTAGAEEGSTQGHPGTNPAHSRTPRGGDRTPLNSSTLGKMFVLGSQTGTPLTSWLGSKRNPKAKSLDGRTTGPEAEAGAEVILLGAG